MPANYNIFALQLHQNNNPNDIVFHTALIDTFVNRNYLYDMDDSRLEIHCNASDQVINYAINEPVRSSSMAHISQAIDEFLESGPGEHIKHSTIGSFYFQSFKVLTIKIANYVNSSFVYGIIPFSTLKKREKRRKLSAAESSSLFLFNKMLYGNPSRKFFSTFYSTLLAGSIFYRAPS